MLLPAGYTRLLFPPTSETNAPPLPLFGYTFACVVDDELYVAAMKTDEGEDWQPRTFAAGELESFSTRAAPDPGNRVLAQAALCAREYGCFTAQNVFLERGEAAMPVSPKCNARCVGCISEQEPDAGFRRRRRASPSRRRPMTRAHRAHHLERVADGIVSFGQGCEGEPLLRSIAIAAAIERIRPRTRTARSTSTPTALPKSLQR